MKRFLLTFLLCLSIISSFAVEYRSIGSNADFCAYYFDGQYYLILSFKDDANSRLTNQTIIKFKLNNGTILKLEGYDGSRKTTSNFIELGLGFSTGSSNDKHITIVSITQEQIEQLQIGVDKVAINTIPEVYKRSKWSGKEKFGILLYEDFKSLKDEFDEGN